MVTSDSASFLTRLRHSSFISAALAGHGSFSRSKLKDLVDVEIRLLLQQFDGVGHALAAALLVAAENDEGGFHVAGLDGVVEFVAVLFEFGDVARVEIAAAAVDGIEVSIQDQAREPVIERRAAIVFAGDDVADAAGDVVFLFGGSEHRQRSAGTAAGGVIAAPEQRRQSDRARAHGDAAVTQRERLARGLCSHHRTRSPVNFGRQIVQGCEANVLRPSVYEPEDMRPFTVLIGIVMGSAASITFGLGAV